MESDFHSGDHSQDQDRSAASPEASLNKPEPSFELGIPEIDTEPVGFVTVSGLKKRVQFPDISLAEFLDAVGAIGAADDLHKHKIATHSIDGTHKLKEWSFYRGLVGSLAIGSTRYALNEGKWYSIQDALRDSANTAFANALLGLDTAATPWPIVARSSFPHEWTVEYKFGDFPNVKGDYTIPFFSRVAFDETKREIEAWGYKAVKISFVRLSTPTKKP